MNRKATKFDNICPEVPQSEQKCKISFPDGKEIELPLLRGTDGSSFIDIRNLNALSNHFTFDSGFSCTASCISSITNIIGDQGKLLHRGYKIEDLSESGSYMETCYLLLYGELPSQKDLTLFEKTIVDEMMVHQDLIQFYDGFKDNAHPMAILTGVVGALSAFEHSHLNLNDPKQRELVAIKVIAKMPTLAAISFRKSMGLPIVYPRKDLSYIKNFLYMMFSNPMESQISFNDDIVKAVDTICLLHADHEQNASTSTVRIAGSSLANPYACIAAGIASLWGPAHGGANEAVLDMLEEIQQEQIDVKEFLEKVKNKERRLMGFGHRVYKNFDPRAVTMSKICKKILQSQNQDQNLMNLSMELEQQALNDDYFIKRKLYPNVDFYTGIVYKAIGIPKSMFTVMFAVSRSIGWICQWSEMWNEDVIKIGRPRQIYVGKSERQYIDIKDREEEEKSRIIQVPKVNKMTSLMIL